VDWNCAGKQDKVWTPD